MIKTLSYLILSLGMATGLMASSFIDVSAIKQIESLSPAGLLIALLLGAIFVIKKQYSIILESQKEKEKLQREMLEEAKKEVNFWKAKNFK